MATKKHRHKWEMHYCDCIYCYYSQTHQECACGESRKLLTKKRK